MNIKFTGNVIDHLKRDALPIQNILQKKFQGFGV